MGIIICPRHGRQTIEFAAAAYASVINSGNYDLADKPLCLQVRFIEKELLCPIDNQFAIKNNLERDQDSENFFNPIIDEDQAWSILGDMSPVCSICLEEFWRANAICQKAR